MVSMPRLFRLIVFSILLLVALPFGLSASRPSSVDAQDTGSLQTIESDDPFVASTGHWTTQSASNASGGSYRYSSDSPDDILSLDFYGSFIEIVYVGHPSFGTFAIDIDNDIRRTVVSTDNETTFDNRAVIDYLEDGPHTLRVYSVDGVIAIDAFITHLTPPPSAHNEREEAGVTWWVAPDGLDTNDCLLSTSPCLTIQAAIDKASADDEIRIRNGNYNEAITIDKNLMLTGDSLNQSFIDGTGLSTSVVTVGPGVTVVVEKLTIRNGTSGTLTTVKSSQTYVGAGIYNQGNLTVVDTSVTDNSIEYGTFVAAGVGIGCTNKLTVKLSDACLSSRQRIPLP